MRYKSNHNSVLTSPDVHWIYTPPTSNSSKCLLLTTGGVALIGRWGGSGHYIGWFPLPKRDRAQEVRVALLNAGELVEYPACTLNPKSPEASLNLNSGERNLGRSRYANGQRGGIIKTDPHAQAKANSTQTFTRQRAWDSLRLLVKGRRNSSPKDL